MPNSLAIIGAGRVGRTLGRGLREAGWKIGSVVTRSEASARRAVHFIGAGKAWAGLTRQVLLSQVILITTPDDQIAAVEEAATQLLVSLGMKRREAVRALLPLTRQVLDNFERLGPRAAWTGPLARGDFKVVRAHLQALRESPMEIAHAYEALSRLAARVLAQDTAGTLAELEKSSVKMITRAKATGGNA